MRILVWKSQKSRAGGEGIEQLAMAKAVTNNVVANEY